MMAIFPLLLAAALQPNTSGTYTLSFPVPDFGPMRYSLTLPRGYNARDPRPLILALHPGGQPFPGYGATFTQQIVAPGLNSLGAIIVAPDVPTRSWTDDISDRAVLALVKSVMTDYKVEPSLLPTLAEEAASQWTARFNPRPVMAADFEALYRAAYNE